MSTSMKLNDDDSLMALEEALDRVGILEEDDQSSDSEEESSERRQERTRQDAVSELAFEETEAPMPDNRTAESLIRETVPQNNLHDLRSIVEDDRTFLMFRRFLSDCCITRNLQFWLACEHYRQLPTDNQEKMHEVAQAIYVKFLKSSAPQYVSVKDQTKRQIKICLELRTGPLTTNLFSKAQAEIWSIMEKNEMRQFLLSDAYADCSSFTQIDAANADLYTPSMAKPVYGVCGGGSLQNSGSEDSASVSSFSTEDGGGPRSTVLATLQRPYPTARKALSDTEGSRMRHVAVPHKKGPGVFYGKDKSATQEEFYAMVRERLLAVHKDREMMAHKVRDQARKQGKRTYEEIMALEWYDLPEACKYLRFDVPAPVEGSTSQSTTSHLRPPSSSIHQHIHSDHSASSTPRSSRAEHVFRTHVQSLAAREVQDALKDLEITNEVSKKRLTSGSSSVHTTTDSGVGVDMWGGHSGMMTADDRTRAYVLRHNMMTNAMPERDRDARAAAIALISNSPHPETLNPRIPPQSVIHQHQHQHQHQHDRSRRFNSSHQYVRNYPGAYSDSDTSSCATMSSTSELFIPRRMPPAHSIYSDDSHHRPHYPMQSRPLHHHRRLSSLKRSPQLSKQQHHSPASPSPIAEHHRPQSRSRPPGETLIVYHLDEIPTPYAKRLSSVQDITLGDFKEKVFARNGEFRFFFKTFCEDLEMEIMEEYSDETAVLPLIEGKIIGRVEKV